MAAELTVRIEPVVPPLLDQARADGAFSWVKADLHLHTAEDPFDEIDYTALELLDRAAELGYRVLAVTLHDKVFEDPAAFARARKLGILLISAAELRIEGADTVVLNISASEAAGIETFDDLRRLRASRGESLFVFAPHPYYVVGGSIGSRIEGLLDCFDAIEYCHFHLPIFNPNVSAVRLAKRSGKPLLATSDAHRRKFFGQNYSLLGVDKGQPLSPSAVFDAIRAHRIRRVSPSGGLPRLIAMLLFVFVVHPILTGLPAARRRREAATANNGPASKSPEPAEPALSA